MSNSTNSELRNTGLVLYNPSKIAKAGSGDGGDCLPVFHDVDSRPAVESKVPDSWTEVIEDPELWTELRALLLESE